MLKLNKVTLEMLLKDSPMVISSTHEADGYTAYDAGIGSAQFHGQDQQIELLVARATGAPAPPLLSRLHT